ncbi:hypothetical protein ASPCAL10707 [Aspergillus calidoustus]|uniref:Uncharacterized protein n=1 Tax=Aspergillus calidoustus TaxID=454130 RepID=A0A0U5GAB7_ASPCI|nr:hypothetical protein ASPCAL10707 [Aspergillus calidoustus]
MQQVTSLFKGKQAQQPATNRRKSHDPVLTTEDEAFLRNVTSEELQSGLGAGAPTEAGTGAGEQPPASGSTEVHPPGPISPVEEFGRELGEQERRKSLVEAGGTATTAEPETNGKTKRVASPEKKKRPWSFIWKKGDKKSPETETAPAPESSSPPKDTITDDKEIKQENEDMTEILDRLNLAADNNKVFSISDETQELLRKFKLIFKDLINGVPTAYHDLEMLLTNGNRQLQDTYSNLPSFLQKLIEKLPERWTETLAPEMLAVAAERASQSGMNVENIGKAAAAANKMGIQIPSLKELVGKPAAIVGMLRSIMAFLRARFPAVLGMNVLWSLALFILLFVLWYCHKRGREVRLENERLVTEEEIEKMNQETSDGTVPQIRSTETLTTTAAQGASIEEVRQGIKDAQKSREEKTLPSASASVSAAAEGENKNPEEDKPSGIENEPLRNEPIKPTRSKSILSIFGRRDSAASTPSTSKVAPYPGT